VGDIPCQGRPPFPSGIVSNSRKLSRFPECDRNEANAGVEEAITEYVGLIRVKLLQSGLHIDRVPKHNDVNHQA
jgi:hypothetical protein